MSRISLSGRLDVNVLVGFLIVLDRYGFVGSCSGVAGVSRLGLIYFYTLFASV
jgi:hypothetical protein